MDRSPSTLSGMCLPDAVVLEPPTPGPADAGAYGCCLKAVAVPGW